MTIKNRDGSVFKLRGPNPIMAQQSEWDRSKMRVLNLAWNSEVVEDKRNPIREMKKQVIDVAEVIGFEEPIKPEPKPKVVPAKNFIKEITSAIEPVVIEADSKMERLLSE